jgi:glycosyltransferase involved in cell wall biosynthesis
VTTPSRLAFFFPRISHGGIERVLLNLLSELESHFDGIDILCESVPEDIARRFPDGVRIVPIGSARNDRSLFASAVSRLNIPYTQNLIDLFGYLRATRPIGLVIFQGSLTGAIGARLSRTGAKLVVRESNTPTATVQNGNVVSKNLKLRVKRIAYRLADTIIVNSEGVRRDLVDQLRVPARKIELIYNPTVDPSISIRGAQPVDHPWLAEDESIPVIVAAGRLTFQKDHETLVRAFALARKTNIARLLILGEGERRPSLERLVDDLGLASDIDIAGYVGNPFSYLSRASMFAMTPRYEGLPNAVIEAVACGLPVVCTDCPSGPREILLAGAGGQLVPVGDVNATAIAIVRYLNEPSLAEEHIARGQAELHRFDSATVARKYALLFGRWPGYLA